jgi:hypothetical protein
MAQATRELYIITDIDGTVVPHPYHSGLSQEQRNPYVARLLELMRNHHVACVTGRTLAGWQRLWREAGHEPHLPRLMGLSFGAEIYYHAKHVDGRAQSAELTQVVHELHAALETEKDFRNQAEADDIMRHGRLQGYFFEEKTHIVQLDWNFATEALNLRFAEHVFHALNPHLAKATSLRCQVFHRRIDILANGFVPKAELAHSVRRWVDDTRLTDAARRPDCLVLGDELYDDYLFESMKRLEHDLFHKVTCLGVDNGVGTRFRHADKTVAGPDEAWRAIDGARLFC